VTDPAIVAAKIGAAAAIGVAAIGGGVALGTHERPPPPPKPVISCATVERNAATYLKENPRLLRFYVRPGNAVRLGLAPLAGPEEIRQCGNPERNIERAGRRVP
jgi:hypothetical protein